MPRFFFDIDDGEWQDRDEVGLELPNVEAARKAAIDVLPDLARNALADRNRRDFVSVVRTENDRMVFRAKLSFVAEWVNVGDA